MCIFDKLYIIIVKNCESEINTQISYNITLMLIDNIQF